MTEDVLGMDEAMRLLRKEVANKGADYVYEKISNDEDAIQCVYVHEGRPSCIVGHVLTDFGVDYDLLHKASSWNQSVDAFREGSSASGIPACVSDAAARVLQVAQWDQDSGRTWGQALEAAEQTYGDLGGTE